MKKVIISLFLFIASNVDGFSQNSIHIPFSQIGFGDLPFTETLKRSFNEVFIHFPEETDSISFFLAMNKYEEGIYRKESPKFFSIKITDSFYYEIKDISKSQKRNTKKFLFYDSQASQYFYIYTWGRESRKLERLLGEKGVSRKPEKS